ncbi:hypothetical protein LXA43DRAFT_849763, partial [Ganoderma leucocontextum]
LAQIYGEVSACGEPIQIYVAGAKSSALPGVSAGAGVFFGPANDDNGAFRVPGEQSLARAVLFAALLAIRATPPSSTLRIHCHTDYLPRSVCHWAEHNARQQWKVVNGDILLSLAWLVRSRSGPISIYWM